ncbi:hypothetical protein KIN20_024923 [Parelaphostrongylus tenuis]|uniref:Uncharacterized protein n=1 Tax=Parelaphostrongylus tenuis TaxID=148309 RepID=A0AAD5QXP4_PARTN|nr:hypothetical protein KIN20_024923 [Parelaphostrongylus tenuis]
MRSKRLNINEGQTRENATVKGLSHRATIDEIKEVERDGATSKFAAKRWFQSSNCGNCDLRDKRRSGRPTKFESFYEAEGALSIVTASEIRRREPNISREHDYSQ